MRTHEPSRPACPLTLAFLIAAALARPGAGQVVHCVSVPTGGGEGDGPSGVCSISGDGRFVAFHSQASNLVIGDQNGRWDVFVHDLQLGTTLCVSVSVAGGPADGDSFDPAISGDGQFVAFQSRATNLVAGDMNLNLDVFVRDLAAGTTERISVDSAGLEAQDDSYAPVITPDGRFVAFHSAASNLAPGDTSSLLDVFLRDRMLGTTELISVSSANVHGNGDSWNAALSADGRFVAFQSRATGLVPGDTGGWSDVFVRDRLTGITERVSVSTAGLEADGPSGAPTLSGDGRFVAFESLATNLFPSDLNGDFDVFVHDCVLGTTECVSRSASGVSANGPSDQAAISSDARSVSFRSRADDLAAADTNALGDIFVVDRETGATECVSLSSSGEQADGESDGTSISADGRCVAFRSLASNLVTSDSNKVSDVFVRDRSVSLSTFCFGDGADLAHSTACPCGNFGAAGHGCANSVHVEGAVLGTIGSPFADDLCLAGAHMPAIVSCIYLQGDALADAVFGDGVRCTGGTLLRLRTRINAGGASAFPDPQDSIRLSTRGGVVPGSGVRRYYQAYYRNSSAIFCPPGTFNVTNGVVVDW